MCKEEKARVRYVTLPPGKRILAVSDIHGNLTYFKELLQKIKFSREDILFLVGDLVEKGPESLATLHYVMELEKKYTVYPISGNCESLWLSWRLLAPENRERLREYALDREHSLFNEMLKQVADPISEETDMDEAVALVRTHFSRELAWLDALPNICVTEDFLFVHGGIDPALPLEEQYRIHVMDWPAFYAQQVQFQNRYCIVGHWPVVLYNEETQDASPIIDRQRKIICLDGGNILKRDGQLNVLVIPEKGSENFSWEYYEDYPMARVLDVQAAGVLETDMEEASKRGIPHNIIWSDNEVELLRQDSDSVLVRQVSSGRIHLAPLDYLYYDHDRLRVEDITNVKLELSPGDQVALVIRTAYGSIVKHGGKSGWYQGSLEEMEPRIGRKPGFWRERVGHIRPFVPRETGKEVKA